MKKIAIQIYAIVFLLTIAIIASALYGSIYINKKRTDTINTVESKIAIDIFALETKIDLLKESECKKVVSSDISDELNELSSRLSFMEQQLGLNDPEIFRLKRYYGLLEIKGYIIGQKLAARCKIPDISVMYFYDHSVSCLECLQQEYVLDELRREKKDINIYALDYIHDIQALQAYTTIKELPEGLPLLFIHDKAYQGFKSVEDITAIIASSTATSTKLK